MIKGANTLLITCLALLIGLSILSSCDPAHNGNSYINNQSTFELRLDFKSYSPLHDTTILIQPNTTLNFFKLGGLGAGKDYDCCPCDFETITLQPTDTSKSMIKNINDQNNWILTNPNKRKYSNKEIDCEFVVTQSDIQ